MITGVEGYGRQGWVQNGGMPSYDVRCRSCGDTFEVSRPMANIDDPAPCPNGHTDTVRLLRTVAMTGKASGSQRSAAQAPAPSGGGCCGGGCCG